MNMPVAVPGGRHPSAQPGRLAGQGGTVGADICKRADVLAADRSSWERDWRDIADFCLPSASRGMSTPGMPNRTWDRLVDTPSSRVASRRRFDSTAMTAIDRLASGMESLVTPQSEKWHGLDLDDLDDESTEEQRAWFERVRDKQFAVRYEPRAGFITANQKALRSCIAFGTGIKYVEEAFGAHGLDQRAMPIIYRHIPLSQAYLAVNAQGIPDTLIRRPGMTARQAIQRLGPKVSDKIKEAAEDPKKCDHIFGFIHAVMPREEAGSRNANNRNSAFASYWIEEDGKHLVSDGGFFEFPYVVYYWLQSDEAAYGESPVMLALDDIRGLNVTRKTALRAMQQWTDPPIGIAHDGVMNRPNLNPGKLNFGAIDSQGRQKIQALMTVSNPAVVQEIIESERNGVREILYNNLFQILLQNPNMTATEAMLRANEKGELLGPAGAKLQEALAHMIDREFSILLRKGAFEPGASLEAPESLQGRRFSPRFTSPLDRLRQAKEGVGVMTAYQAAAQIASAKGDPSVFDNFDDDKAVKLIADVNGAPASVMRLKDDVDKIRQQRAEAAQQAQQLAAAEQAAKAAKDAGAAAVDGTAAAGNAAALQDQMGDMNVAPPPLPQLAPGPEGLAA